MFPRTIRRDIILLLCLKAAALTLIYFMFVAPVIHPEPDGRAMQAHLMGKSAN